MHNSHLATSFLGLPTWYEFLPTNGDGTPEFQHLTDIYLVIAAIIDILLRIGAIVAIIMVIYGGIEFITSQGNPDKAASARTIILNAIIGLVIAVTAATIITFIAGRFTSQ
jgi:phosphotransferase system  glucose/maltose/N-acetylglucosamine-specific IIC component